MGLSEFSKVLADIKLANPGISYKQAQALAKLQYKTLQPAKVEPVIHKECPFDQHEVESAIRAGVGMVHIRATVYNFLKAYNPEIITDSQNGSVATCHVIAIGFRVPADRNDYFKYPCPSRSF